MSFCIKASPRYERGDGRCSVTRMAFVLTCISFTDFKILKIRLFYAFLLGICRHRIGFVTCERAFLYVIVFTRRTNHTFYICISRSKETLEFLIVFVSFLIKFVFVIVKIVQNLNFAKFVIFCVKSLKEFATFGAFLTFFFES